MTILANMVGAGPSGVLNLVEVSQVVRGQDAVHLYRITRRTWAGLMDCVVRRFCKGVVLRLCTSVEDLVDNCLGFVVDAMGIVVEAALVVPLPIPGIRQEDAGHVAF